MGIVCAFMCIFCLCVHAFVLCCVVLCCVVLCCVVLCCVVLCCVVLDMQFSLTEGVLLMQLFVYCISSDITRVQV